MSRKSRDMQPSRFAISRTVPSPTTPGLVPPTRFAPTPHDPTAFPDPLQQQQSPPRGKSRNHSRSSSLNSGYQSPMNYPAPVPLPAGPPALMLTPSGTITPGIYEIRSNVWSSAVDLNASDRRSVIAFSYHGEGNQQWEFSPLGRGWSIRSVSSGLYISVEKGIGNGVPVVASEFPVAWYVQVDNAHLGIARIFWPNTECLWELPDGRAGTPIQMANKYPQDQQDTRVWRLTRIGDSLLSTTDPRVFEYEKEGRRHRKGYKHGHHHRNSRHWEGKGGVNKQGASDDSSSSSSDDSDMEVTIVKTITKTKTKKGKGRKGKGMHRN